VLLLVQLLVQVPEILVSVSAANKLDVRESNAEAGQSPQAVTAKPKTQSRRNKLVSALKVTIVVIE